MQLLGADSISVSQEVSILIPKACGCFHFPNPLIDLEVLLEEQWQFLAHAQQFVLRLQYDFQLYQDFSRFQQGHLKNSRLRIVKLWLNISSLFFNFRKRYCHNDLGLRWLLFEVPQTYQGMNHAAIFCSCSSRSKGLCNRSDIFVDQLDLDFRYCQWLVWPSWNGRNCYSLPLQTDCFRYQPNEFKDRIYPFLIPFTKCNLTLTNQMHVFTASTHRWPEGCITFSSFFQCCQ